MLKLWRQPNFIKSLIFKLSTILTRQSSKFFIILFFFASVSNAQTYAINSKKIQSNPILGETIYIYALENDTPASIGKEYNVGVNSILAANPGTNKDTVFRKNTIITVPTSRLLPNIQRKGIIVNLPEMRLYYYLPDEEKLMTFPIGIGKIGNTIPIKKAYILRKKKNPKWTPPPSIRKFNKEHGITLPKVMQAGPENPLGPYAIYLSLPTYLIHSTIFPESIGKRASFGCIRMHENDIKQFFTTVKLKTPVNIINQPNKIAWKKNSLFIELHPPLKEHEQSKKLNLNIIRNLIQSNLPKNKETIINWQIVNFLAAHPDGIPHQIGIKL